MQKTSFILFILISISWISSSFKLLDSFFVFYKWPTSTIYKSRLSWCISDINLSPANKFVYYFIHYILLKQKKLGKGILFKGFLIPKLLTYLLASSSLINFNFLLSHILHFDKSIVFPFFVLSTFVFLLSVIFLHFKQYDYIVLEIEQNVR